MWSYLSQVLQTSGLAYVSASRDSAETIILHGEKLWDMMQI